MDITQVVLGIGAVLGIVIVCVLAIVPTVMGLQLPEHRNHRPPLRTVHGAQRPGGRPTKPDRKTDHRPPVDLAA